MYLHRLSCRVLVLSTYLSWPMSFCTYYHVALTTYVDGSSSSSTFHDNGAAALGVSCSCGASAIVPAGQTPIHDDVDNDDDLMMFDAGVCDADVLVVGSWWKRLLVVA